MKIKLAAGGGQQGKKKRNVNEVHKNEVHKLK